MWWRAKRGSRGKLQKMLYFYHVPAGISLLKQLDVGNRCLLVLGKITSVEGGDIMKERVLLGLLDN